MSVPFLHIEPTNRCNLDCVMCTRRELKRFGCMSLEKLKHILDQVPGLEAVKLQGMGEPMLNREIIPMMEYLRSRSIRVYTAMNGTLLPEDMKGFVEAVDRIEYSIDSVDRNEYKRIRGAANLDTVLENLRILCGAREEHPDVMISINSVIHDGNEECFEGLFRLAQDTGVDRINFNIVQNWSVNGNRRDETLTERDMDAVETIAAHLSRKYDVTATVHRPVYGYSACTWAKIGCYITWDGFVTPCCQRPDPDEINFGNIFTTSFDSIYYSPRYVDFREELLHDEPPYECSSCSVYIPRQVENGCALSRQP